MLISFWWKCLLVFVDGSVYFTVNDVILWHQFGDTFCCLLFFAFFLSLSKRIMINEVRFRSGLFTSVFTFLPINIYKQIEMKKSYPKISQISYSILVVIYFLSALNVSLHPWGMTNVFRFKCIFYCTKCCFRLLAI